VEFIPRRAVARETLDGVPIRFFILNIIFRILADLRAVRDQADSAWVCRSEFLKFPNLLIVVCRGRGWKDSMIWIASSCVSQINFTAVAAVNI
jgi:hypothetical protein